MKVTFIEEIEARKAFFPSMKCRRCGSPLYEIHHQTAPTECWWIKCSTCGCLGPESPTKLVATERWKQ